MKLFLLLILIFPKWAVADFVASAGLQGGEFKSSNRSSAGKPLLDSSGIFGFRGEIEYGHPYITLYGAFDFSAGQAKTQYNYTNPYNALDLAQVNDLKTTIGLSRFSGGLRVRLLKLKKFRLYIGGGYQYGILNLLYDKDDFKKKNSSTTGFEETEKQISKGVFGEVGMEFILDNDSGLRFQAQRAALNTEKFETLGETKINTYFTSFSASYIQYIDTGNW